MPNSLFGKINGEIFKIIYLKPRFKKLLLTSMIFNIMAAYTLYLYNVKMEELDFLEIVIFHLI